MATITVNMFSALDGVVDPGAGNWHFPYFNDEMGAAVEKTHDADVMLFGYIGLLAYSQRLARERREKVHYLHHDEAPLPEPALVLQRSAN